MKIKKFGLFALAVYFLSALSGIATNIFSAEKIVFTKEYYYNNPPVQGWFSDIWTMNTDGSNATQLTTLGVPYTAEEPTLSPDGKWIAFTSSYCSWRSALYKDIFVIGTNGTQLTRLTGGEYITPIDSGTLHGLVYDNTGTDIQEIQINITYQGSNQFYHPTKIADHTFEYTIPNVPSGKIWVKASVSQYKGSLIFPVINAGTVNTVENMYLESGNYLAGSPNWAPDMSKVTGIFSYSCYDHTDSTNQCKGSDNISVWAIDGTQLGTRSSTYPFDGFPRYSPDGTKIAFSYGVAFQQSLVTVPSDDLSATPTVIVPGGIDYVNLIYYAAVYPAWSPDGNKVAFTYQALDGNMNIYGALFTADSDGSDTVTVVPFTTNGFPIYPSFSLDGTKLIYTLMQSKGTYLNIISDLATHNYTTDIWELDLVKKTTTKLTTSGAASGGFWGNFNPVAIEEKSKIKNQNVKLEILQNPFINNTIIRYVLPEYTNIRLTIYDLSGRCVKTLVNELKPAGSYSVTLGTKDLTSGIYFAKLDIGNYKEARKFILLK
ncbi:MAG: T9SS type A sorting domain-containing protein [bacterium]|nr:T9SS type A sorting domain-containing protein [bacterium]